LGFFPKDKAKPRDIRFIKIIFIFENHLTTMKTYISDQRASGILAHITSLPSIFGIGDIGPSSYQFLQFLHDSGQRYWQFLPTGPTNPIFDNSPYMSTSAFAGSPLLISPELLHQHNLISRNSLENHPIFSPYTTEFSKVITYKRNLLEEAYRTFSSGKNTPEYDLFLSLTSWLDDYAIYMTMKEKYGQCSWNKWPNEIATHNVDIIAEIKKQEREIVDYYRFEQFEFFRQWQLLHDLARQLDIRLFGDLPMYVGFDSADVWANQEIFTLDLSSLEPTHVAGVPPDYFSKTGQRWGNPLYTWSTADPSIQKKLLDWWCRRFSAVFTMVDVARIDHFRGFESYWSIPSHEETALNGQWLKGPGKQFFNEIFSKLGQLDIVAEDLGEITPAVIELKDSIGFPGMKILQFAFDSNPENSFLPYNFNSSNCVVYTGTHDNDTTVGWYLSDKLTDTDRSRIKQFANREGIDVHGIHKDLIHLALSSIARLAIFPLQDILGFGNDCKMNSPGTKKGNWIWRCGGEFLTAEVSSWLRQQTELFGRGRKNEKQVT
jgi:4-alpha-glucanotransferase